MVLETSPVFEELKASTVYSLFPLGYASFLSLMLSVSSRIE